jgi:hypothetical protein
VATRRVCSGEEEEEEARGYDYVCPDMSGSLCIVDRLELEQTMREVTTAAVRF